MSTDKIQKYQKLIDASISLLKNRCETMNTEDDEYVSFDACDLIDNGVKVSLNDVEKLNDTLLLIVDVTYKNWEYLDESSFILELENELKIWIGKNKIRINMYKNTFPEHLKQW
jgi:hypothetical protein